MLGGGTGRRPRQLGHRARAARAVDARQPVELADVQVGIVERGHRAGVVEEASRGCGPPVVKRHWYVMSSTASPLLSMWIS